MVQVKVEPIDRDIQLLLNDALSPAAQSAMFADYAEEQIKDAKDTDTQILGREPRVTVSVDGNKGAALESVKPGGEIIAEFELFSEVLEWIQDQLILHSPVGSGRDPHPGLYRQSHTLFADGVEIAPGADIPDAEEYVFINDVPYARKIELGRSSQAPDGVYQAVAHLAAQRFGNMAKISFTFRTFIGGKIAAWAATTTMSSKGHASAKDRAEWLSRQPAIIVKMRGV